MYTLISRHARVSLIPNQQAQDELIAKYNRGKPPATLRRAEWMKELLETNKTVKISIFLLTMLATAMVISDAVLTPAISGKKNILSHEFQRTVQNLNVFFFLTCFCLPVLSAVGGLKEKAPYLTTGTRDFTSFEEILKKLRNIIQQNGRFFIYFFDFGLF